MYSKLCVAVVHQCMQGQAYTVVIITMGTAAATADHDATSGSIL